MSVCNEEIDDDFMFEGCKTDYKSNFKKLISLQSAVDHKLSKSLINEFYSMCNTERIIVNNTMKRLYEARRSSK